MNENELKAIVGSVSLPNVLTNNKNQMDSITGTCQENCCIYERI